MPYAVNVCECAAHAWRPVRNKTLLVDADQKELLEQHGWYATNKGYFMATRHRDFVILHREIVAVTQDALVDHRNHNKADNRRANLRPCTASQSMGNRRKFSIVGAANPTSKYKGVTWQVAGGARPWAARLHCNGSRKYLGVFSSEADAARAYDAAAKEYFGEFAYLNFPERAQCQ